MIFLKIFLRVGQKLGEFCCAYFLINKWEKVPIKIRRKICKNVIAQFCDNCRFCASNKMSLHFVEGVI